MSVTPQYDVEAALLNVLKNRWPQAAKILDLRDDLFIDKNHRLLFRLFCKTQRENGSWDDNLLRVSFTEMGGDIDTYYHVASTPTNPNNTDLYITEIIKSAKAQKLLQYFNDAAKVDKEPIEILRLAMNDLEELEGMRLPRVRGSNIEDISISFRDKEYVKPMSSGFKTINRLLGGLRSEEMTALGAPPGAGKSALAAAIGYNIAKEGKTTLFFSKEMLSERIFSRLLAMVSETTVGLWEEYKSGEAELSTFELERLKSVISLIGGMKDHFIFFDLEDSNEMTPATIAEEIKAQNYALRASGRQVDFVIIDYMQILNMEETANLARSINNLARELKQISLQQHCHILVLSAVSRASAMTLEMSAFRDSSGIEYNIDNGLLMVNRRDLNTSSMGEGWTGENPFYVPLVVRGAKIRNAEGGKVGYLRFAGSQQRFSEMSKDERDAFKLILAEEEKKY